jgi:probable rRNA maturation factor
VTVRLVIEDGPHQGLSRADIVRRGRAMLEAARVAGAELSVVLMGDERIADLNRLYRKKDRPTDVLAFAQREGEMGDRAGRLLGDVVISVPTARRQATARGADLVSEVTMLLAHGLLHLLGWDHETPSTDRRMRREAERLCAAAARENRAAAAVRAPSKATRRPRALGRSKALKDARTER